MVWPPVPGWVTPSAPQFHEYVFIISLATSSFVTQAMDRCVTRLEVANEIIKTYS